MMQTVSKMGFEAKEEKPGSALASRTQAAMANQMAGHCSQRSSIAKARRAGATEVEV